MVEAERVETGTVEATKERLNATRTGTTYSSRDFHQQAGRAKKAAESGPVFITDRGQLTHVLLRIVEYHRLRGQQSGKALFEALYCPELAEIDDDFEFPKLEWTLRLAEFGTRDESK